MQLLVPLSVSSLWSCIQAAGTILLQQAQTHGGNQERRKAQEELAHYTARSYGLQSEIEALRQETAELQVLVVKLKTPSPKVGSCVGHLVPDISARRD